MRIDRRRFLGYAGASVATTQLLGYGRDRLETADIPRRKLWPTTLSSKSLRRKKIHLRGQAND